MSVELWLSTRCRGYLRDDVIGWCDFLSGNMVIYTRICGYLPGAVVIYWVLWLSILGLCLSTRCCGYQRRCVVICGVLWLSPQCCGYLGVATRCRCYLRGVVVTYVVAQVNK